jgi:uroporphyrinogen III methyltransferase/synthase
VPIAALGRLEGERLWLEGAVSSIDGKRFFRDRIEGAIEDPEELGQALAELLIGLGAKVVLDETLARSAHPEPSSGAIAAEPARTMEAGVGVGPTGIGLRERVAEGHTSRSAEGVGEAHASAEAPLRGRRVIVTRDEDVDGPLSRALMQRGAEVVCLPLIEHLPPLNPEPLKQAAQELDSFEWIVFTSARAVDAMVAALGGTRSGLSDYTGKIACVGPATAQRVETAGGRVELTPREAKGEALGAAITEYARRGLMRPGSQILFPRADRAGTAATDAFLEFGAIVHDVEAYRTAASRRASAQLITRLESSWCDAVALASASAAEALLELCGAERIKDFARRRVLTTIGSSTSEPLRQAGVDPLVEATRHTFEGLADALAEHFFRRKQR